MRNHQNMQRNYIFPDSLIDRPLILPYIWFTLYKPLAIAPTVFNDTDL
jgi:hypothetical protein